MGGRLGRVSFCGVGGFGGPGAIKMPRGGELPPRETERGAASLKPETADPRRPDVQSGQGPRGEGLAGRFWEEETPIRGEASGKEPGAGGGNGRPVPSETDPGSSPREPSCWLGFSAGGVGGVPSHRGSLARVSIRLLPPPGCLSFPVFGARHRGRGGPPRLRRCPSLNEAGLLRVVWTLNFLRAGPGCCGPSPAAAPAPPLPSYLSSDKRLSPPGPPVTSRGVERTVTVPPKGPLAVEERKWRRFRNPHRVRWTGFALAQ